MSTPEQKVYSRLKKQLIERWGKANVVIQRIETSTGSGIPDVFVMIRGGMVGWIETKAVSYVLSPEQYAWMSQYKDRGGECWVVTLWQDKLLWLGVDKRMLDFNTLKAYIEWLNT